MNNYTILYITDDFNVPETMIIWAEDSDHAEKQANNMGDAYGEGFEVVWIVETDDVNNAYYDYYADVCLEIDND